MAYEDDIMVDDGQGGVISLAEKKRREQQQEKYTGVSVLQAEQPKEKGTVQKLIDGASQYLTPKKSLLQSEAERRYAQKKRALIFAQAERMAEAKIQREQERQARSPTGILKQVKEEQKAQRISRPEILSRAEEGMAKEYALERYEGRKAKYGFTPEGREAYRAERQMALRAVSPTLRLTKSMRKELKKMPKSQRQEFLANLRAISKGPKYISRDVGVRAVVAMTEHEKNIARIQKQLAQSMVGARKIEKGISKERATMVGMGGFLFPMIQTGMRTKGMARGKAGRPAGVYKYTIPGVGPVHVYTWRKWLRSQRQKAEQRMLMQQQAYAQAMTRRGVPMQTAFERAQAIAAMRQQQAIQEAQQEVMPQQYQYPQQQQIVQSQPPVQARAPINLLGSDRIMDMGQSQQSQQLKQAPPGMKVVHDFFTGRDRLEPNRVGTERWALESHPQRSGQLGLRRQTQGGY